MATEKKTRTCDAIHPLFSCVCELKYGHENEHAFWIGSTSVFWRTEEEGLPEIMSAQEFLDAEVVFPEHPRAVINYDNLTLTVHGPYPYEIDLERCGTSARLLDTIMQVAHKPWCDCVLLRQMFYALEEAVYNIFGKASPIGTASVQGVFCPCGIPKVVDWATGKHWVDKFGEEDGVRGAKGQ